MQHFVADLASRLDQLPLRKDALHQGLSCTIYQSNPSTPTPFLALPINYQSFCGLLAKANIYLMREVVAGTKIKRYAEVTGWRGTWHNSYHETGRMIEEHVPVMSERQFSENDIATILGISCAPATGS